MTYLEYKEKRQAEMNALPIFYAFNDEQFAEKMKEHGLTEHDTDKILAVGKGFCLKSDAEIIRAFIHSNALPELMKDTEFAEDAFFYEMCNHEYGINWEGDWEVLSCFGNVKYSDEEGALTDYFNQLNFTEEQRKAYRRARRRYYKEAEEKEWF